MARQILRRAKSATRVTLRCGRPPSRGSPPGPPPGAEAAQASTLVQHAPFDSMGTDGCNPWAAATFGGTHVHSQVIQSDCDATDMALNEDVSGKRYHVHIVLQRSCLQDGTSSAQRWPVS
jgi:hypothetical protein